jgi:hypothetical protein
MPAHQKDTVMLTKTINRHAFKTVCLSLTAAVVYLWLSLPVPGLTDRVFRAGATN